MRNSTEAEKAEPTKPAPLPERFYENISSQFVGVAGSIVYVGVPSREDFDKIRLPVEAHEGRNGHVLVKTLGDYSGKTATVIFQHWIRSLTIDGIRVNRLLDQRHELLNSFGEGGFKDGQTRHRIEEIEAQIREIGAGAELDGPSASSEA